MKWAKYVTVVGEITSKNADLGYNRDMKRR